MSNSKLFTGIDHPAIAVKNVDEMAEWYCTCFGYEKYFRHPKPVWLLKAADNSLLEIMPEDNTMRPERTTWTPGWSHIAIRVTNLEEAVEQLEKHGVQWGGEIISAIGGGRVRNLFDPEGNMLQILERKFD